jgi:hypothetical protein
MTMVYLRFIARKAQGEPLLVALQRQEENVGILKLRTRKGKKEARGKETNVRARVITLFIEQVLN